MDNIAIVWFRNDLRLHDNEMLCEAIKKATSIIPVYVFDERLFWGKTSFGFEKISNFRTKFIIESVLDLQKNIRDKGGDLIIRIGKPEDEVFEIAKQTKSSFVYCNRERTEQEVFVQDRLEHNLWTLGQELRFARGKMLYYTADLPFPISQVPDIFTNYRKEVENIVPLRDALSAPQSIPFPITELDRGEVPTLKTFGKNDVTSCHLENSKFKGGETEAKNQLNYYLWESHLIDTYKETRNDLMGWDFSSKLSAWLSSGCLSPKYVIAEKNRYEKEVTKNESTYWLYFEILWRDFFRLMGKKYGNKIFKLNGIRNVEPANNTDVELFSKWASGNTGIPFIDANMRQLNDTGFMSNRGRQNVASFLVKDLKMNWIMGAEYFESLLIDYDPCSNYGNWNYIAGVGADPKEDRYFNVMSQAKRYDANGEFIKYWIPALE
ncbi:MAG: DASH family cryptochrome [Saprospiraceae bacterium]|nr:DASH family cryptochrome [Saprospiraceae bacterium]